jgi:CubicO group peptidase (beta-lactamase class C family)
MKKNFLHFAMLFIALLILASCKHKEGPVQPEKVGLSSDTLALAVNEMQELVDSSLYAGITTLVWKDGQKVHQERFGNANLENSLPMEENTIFRIFSMSKPVTAVALMTLYDEGKFQLDDPVAKYIPEFEGAMVYTPAEDGSFSQEPQENELSIRHLLTHTSGIPYGWDPSSYVDSLYNVHGVGGWDSTTIGEKMRKLATLPLKRQPGTQWEYGLSIDVAGYLVEVLSGMPLDEYMKSRIFDPLGMDDTGFYVPEDKVDRFSGVYYRDGQGGLKQNTFMADIFLRPKKVFSGGGGLVSTMGDYLSFCRMLLNGGELNGERILKESTVELIMTDQLPEGATYGDGGGHGLAGAVDLESGVYSWAGAASTNFWIDPKNEIIIITYAQLMPSDHSYAHNFRDIVYRAILDK